MAQPGPGQGVSGPSEHVGELGRLGRPRPYSASRLHSKFPQTATEWAEILALQKQFHSVEVHKWRQILRASVELLDEVGASPGQGPGRAVGAGALPSLGLRLLLCKMRKPFLVPTSRSCWRCQREEEGIYWFSSWKKAQGSCFRSGWIQFLSSVS